jgi:tetratricopeptide (TPR) repeat protein
LGWSQGARAAYWQELPEGDFQYLPEYCKLAVRRYGDQHRTLKGATKEQLAPLYAFEKRVGCAGDLHHYCAGLWLLAILNRTHLPAPRDGYLKDALSEFAYTLKGCDDPNAPLKPEILTNQGRAYIGLKQYGNAATVLTEAIRRNPKYVAAYAELSGVFLLLNNREDARKILEDGLRHSPDSTFLKLKLERLGPSEKKAPNP